MSVLETNIQKAAGYLQRFRASTLGHFIAGKAQSGASAQTIENVSPVDSSVLNKVSCGDERDVDAAAAAARNAFPAWRDSQAMNAARSCTASPTRSRRAREEIALVECWTRASRSAS